MKAMEMKSLDAQKKVAQKARDMWLAGCTLPEVIESFDSISLTCYFDLVMLYNSLDSEFKSGIKKIETEET
jgi:hypothetical protein